jgi:hypothetical protein
MINPRDEQQRRHLGDEAPPSPERTGWLSVIWGGVVIAVFVAVRAAGYLNNPQGQPAQPQVVTTALPGDGVQIQVRGPAASSMPQDSAGTQDAPRLAVPEGGVSVNLVIHSCSAKYSSSPHGELDLAQQDADIESVVELGGRARHMRSKSGRQGPDLSAGEYDRCQLIFGNDGRVFLDTRERAAMVGGDWLEVTGSYELKIVEGTRADYEAGKTIQLAYTPEGLAKRRNALQKSLAVQWMPILKRELSGDATSRDLPENLVVQCLVESLPQATMHATNSTLVIEDGGPVKASITMTVPKH